MVFVVDLVKILEYKFNPFYQTESYFSNLSDPSIIKHEKVES